MKVTPDPKPQTMRSEKYKQFIRSMNCLACGCGPTVCHHEPLHGHGTACKGPDNESVPLCMECHHERHLVGRETFYDRHGIDWRYHVGVYQELFKVWKQPGAYEGEEIHTKIGTYRWVPDNDNEENGGSVIGEGE